MSMILVIGEIPWGVRRVGTGRYLTPDSFGVRRSGIVPVAWRHWRDNEKSFVNNAMWGALSTGLTISHTLDDSVEFEASVLEAVKRQLLTWSYGFGANPSATRQAIAAGEGRHIAYAEKPLEYVTVEHVSYVPGAAAFAQQPIRWIGF